MMDGADGGGTREGSGSKRGPMANIDALFAKEAAQRLARKSHGAARDGQRRFVRVGPDGAPVGSGVTASHARAAATQLFNLFMRKEGRDLARSQWQPLVMPSRDADPQWQTLLKRMRANIDLTARNTFHRCVEAREALRGGAEDHQHLGTLQLVVREWLPLAQAHAGLSAAEAEHLAMHPEDVSRDDLTDALERFQARFAKHFEAPLDAASDPDARFLYLPHFCLCVRAVADGDGDGDGDGETMAFLCAVEPNTAPSTMELVKSIVHRTRVAQVGSDAAAWTPDGAGTAWAAADAKLKAAQRRMLQRKHGRFRTMDQRATSRELSSTSRPTSAAASST